MTWFFGVLVVLMIGGIAVVAAGKGETLAPADGDLPTRSIPEGRPISAADLRAVRLSTAVRGYRMAEVDDLLDRLTREAEERESGA